jgi:sigma-E factor negative regulatory protein RseC
MGLTATEKDVFIHSGVISALTAETVTVTLSNNIHCESCSAKGACGVSDGVDRSVEIEARGSEYAIDEPVEVILKKNLGYKAVIWAYILPFTLMLTTLVIASFFLEEWLAGLLSILVLIPYFTLIYGLKLYFRDTFKITLQRN